MKYFKQILYAIILSLPLIPFLVMSSGSVDKLVNFSDLTIVPLALEITTLAMLAGISRMQKGRYSEKERRYFLIIVIGIFSITSLIVIGKQLTLTVPVTSHILFFIVLLYALTNTIIATRKISTSSQKIERYFVFRYFMPASVSLIIMVLIAQITPQTINGVALYYMFKNFVR